MISVRDVMTSDVVSVKENLPIYEALDLLMKHKVSGLPVVNETDEVVGILSEKDVLRMLMDKNLGIKDTASDYMTANVICFTEDDSPLEICKFFIRSHIRRVPIVKDGKLVGIVSRRDIVNMILEAKSKISDMRYV